MLTLICFSSLFVANLLTGSLSLHNFNDKNYLFEVDDFFFNKKNLPVSNVKINKSPVRAFTQPRLLSYQNSCRKKNKFLRLIKLFSKSLSTVPLRPQEVKGR